MRTAAAAWSKNRWEEMKTPGQLEYGMEACLQEAAGRQADIIVFPAFTGCFYQQLQSTYKSPGEFGDIISPHGFIQLARELSNRYDMAICPGSYWERHEQNVYHVSCIFENGNMKLEQRQLYLSRWERELGLSRGTDVKLCDIEGWKVGIVLSADVFYPQVSRRLALMGADAVLCPVGFTGAPNEILQISGMWRDVQQNLFFAVESGFNGCLLDKNFWGKSYLHAPLAMTSPSTGCLAADDDTDCIVCADMDNQQRQNAIMKFDVISRLNSEFYSRMGMFDGKR